MLQLKDSWHIDAQKHGFVLKTPCLLDHIALSINDVLNPPPLTTTSWYVVSKNPKKKNLVGPAKTPIRSYRVLLTCNSDVYQLKILVILTSLRQKHDKKINYSVEFSCDLEGSLASPIVRNVQAIATLYFRAKNHSPALLGHLGLVHHEAIHKLALNVNIAALPTLYYVNPEIKAEWSQIRYSSDWEDIQNLTLDQNLSIAKSLTQSLCALHQHHIFHRDVAPRNVLIDSYCRGFLGDFDHTEKRAGALDYSFSLHERYPFWDSAAHDDIVSPFTDVYGLGVTLMLMVARLLEPSLSNSFYKVSPRSPYKTIVVEDYRCITKNALFAYYKTAVSNNTWTSPNLTSCLASEIRLLMTSCHLFNFIERILRADITLKERLRNSAKRRNWLHLLESEKNPQKILEDMHTFSPSLHELESILTRLQNYSPKESDLNFLVSLTCWNYDYRELVREYPLYDTNLDNLD